MTKLNKTIILLFLFCSILIIFSSLNLFRDGVRAAPSIKIGNIQFKTEIAANAEQWQQGLSDRQTMCGDCGMLFIFPDKKSKQFWMKDMKFPLDIIWISDSRVVGVSRKLPAPKAGELPLIIDSPKAVNWVLEVNAEAAKSIKEGDKVELVQK